MSTAGPADGGTSAEEPPRASAGESSDPDRSAPADVADVADVAAHPGPAEPPSTEAVAVTDSDVEAEPLHPRLSAVADTLEDSAAEPGEDAPDQPGEPTTADGEPAPARPDLNDPHALRAALEAVLFVVESPVTLSAIATSLQRPVAEIEAAVADLRADLDARGSGIELREIAGGVRLYTRPEAAPWVEAFLLEGQRARLTQAALETLAVIAYRQPVTRARISAIRGVNVDGVVRTLTARGLITEVGADPETGGGLFRTTELFLEKMGLQSLDELPSLAPLLPELDGSEVDELSG